MQKLFRKMIICLFFQEMCSRPSASNGKDSWNIKRTTCRSAPCCCHVAPNLVCFHVSYIIVYVEVCLSLASLQNATKICTSTHATIGSLNAKLKRFKSLNPEKKCVRHDVILFVIHILLSSIFFSKQERS